MPRNRTSKQGVETEEGCLQSGAAAGGTAFFLVYPRLCKYFILSVTVFIFEGDVSFDESVSV
jgi:hypothetical protein